ncbi:MAG: hypothetical protein K2Y14_08430 [Burkholderiales bacterium]|nr:hypothetical protein [Burkholderiales bacterium]
MESNIIVSMWAEHNAGFLTLVGIIVAVLLAMYVKPARSNNKIEQRADNGSIVANNSKLDNVGNGKK